MNFQLTSKYKPTGDQPEAIRQLTDGVRRGDKAQVLLGVTGSGKTFTMANVIAKINRPTLILSHNKTLAAQLYEEMKGFFPDNAVEYYNWRTCNASCARPPPTHHTSRNSWRPSWMPRLFAMPLPAS